MDLGGVRELPPTERIVGDDGVVVASASAVKASSAIAAAVPALRAERFADVAESFVPRTARDRPCPDGKLDQITRRGRG
jgi:hypothetical protein